MCKSTLILLFYFIVVPWGVYAQDICATAEEIPGIPDIQFRKSLCEMNADYSNVACLNDRSFGGKDYVLKFTPKNTNTIKIQTQFTGTVPYRMGIALLNACPESGGQCISFDEFQRPHNSADNYPLILDNINVQEGQTYYLIVAVGNDCQTYPAPYSNGPVDMGDCFVFYRSEIEDDCPCGFIGPKKVDPSPECNENRYRYTCDCRPEIVCPDCSEFHISITECPAPVQPVPSGDIERVQCGNNLGFEDGCMTGWTAFQGGNKIVSIFDADKDSLLGLNEKGQIRVDEVGFSHDPCYETYDLGDWQRGAASTNPRDYQAWNQTVRHSVTSGNQTDPRTDNQITVVAPGGGTTSARIGNIEPGWRSECMENTFLVTKDNALFTYLYSVVLEDPTNRSHGFLDSPRFTAGIYDENGRIIPCAGDYEVVSLDAQCQGFRKSGMGDTWYRPWTAVGTDLSRYIGQQVTVRFCTADCRQGGHFCYAYVDTYCQPTRFETNVVCRTGGSVTLTAPYGFQEYTWFRGGDTSAPVMGIGNQITVNDPADGEVFTVLFESITGTGCLSMVTDTVRVVTLEASGDTTYCDNAIPSSFQLNANITGPDDLQINWTANPGPFNGDSNLPNPVINPAPSVTTTYTISVFHDTGCEITENIVVVVEPCGRGIGLQVNSDEFCINAEDTIHCTLLEAVVSDGTPPFTFSWTGLPFDPGNTNIVEVCTEVPLNYTVTVVDSAGLTASASGQIVVQYPPEVTIEPDSFCIGFRLGSLTANATGGNPPYTYVWSDQNNQTTQTATGLPEGSYTVTVTDSKGCWDTASSWISSRSYEGGYNDYIGCPGEIIQVEAQPGGQTYRWRPATGLSNPNAHRPLATVNEPITYFIEVTTGHDCGWIDTVEIEVEYDPTYTLHIPNSFTPNEDGNDDFFQYQGDFSGIVRFECQIWNRWGEKIFHTYKLYDYWNGRYNNVGEYVKDGAYVYIIRAKDDCASIRKGWDYRFGWVIVLKGDS